VGCLLGTPAPVGFLGPGQGQTGINGGEWVGCAAGSARFGGIWVMERQNRIVWRFCVLWRLIFATGCLSDSGFEPHVGQRERPREA